MGALWSSCVSLQRSSTLPEAFTLPSQLLLSSCLCQRSRQGNSRINQMQAWPARAPCRPARASVSPGFKLPTLGPDTKGY